MFAWLGVFIFSTLGQSITEASFRFLTFPGYSYIILEAHYRQILVSKVRS
jgi:hypothetical protein